MKELSTDQVRRRVYGVLGLVVIGVGVASVGLLGDTREALVVSAPAPASADAESRGVDALGVQRATPEDIPAPTTSGERPLIEPPEFRGLPASAPTNVRIPSLDVASTLVSLGLRDDGSLEVPEQFELAGWYADGPVPGSTNSPPALIVGHVDSKAGPAVFFPLKQIEVGAEIEVERADGSLAVFVVTSAEQFPKESLPTDAIYATRTPSELVLVTCTGEFSRENGSYLDNFVVTARLDREASLARSA